MDGIEGEVRSIRNLQLDQARELREVEEWIAEMKPFLEQLQADLIYRQRRHAESAGEWSLLAKILIAVTSILITVSAVGGFVLAIVRAFHGGGS